MLFIQKFPHCDPTFSSLSAHTPLGHCWARGLLWFGFAVNPAAPGPGAWEWAWLSPSQRDTPAQGSVVTAEGHSSAGATTLCSPSASRDTNLGLKQEGLGLKLRGFWLKGKDSPWLLHFPVLKRHKGPAGDPRDMRHRWAPGSGHGLVSHRRDYPVPSTSHRWDPAHGKAPQEGLTRSCDTDLQN